MHDPKILVVDDEPGMLEVCAEVLNELPNACVVVEQRASCAARIMASRDWDLLITDLRMPEMDGLELLRCGRRHHPRLPVLILTAFPSVSTAVDSMKLGAADYLTKPFLPEELLASVRRLLAKAPSAQPGQDEGAQPMAAFGEMLGQSSAMRAVFDTILRIARSDVDVLITGETGTGKELVARSIHQNGRRSSGSFVPVDCGAIPEDLLESEFFGHERGAFTGAHTRSMGLLQFANRGTFFLDELGQLPLKLQAKLLRALQERRVRRVGGTQEIDVDVRVIAATSLNLEQETVGGRFRRDLLYRINVAHIHLPPLREREGDIPLLVEHFTGRYAREMDREPIHVEERTMDVLCRYRWPGNVRELQNVLKRAIAMSRTHAITCEDLPESLLEAAGYDPDEAPSGFFKLRDQHLAAFERAYLERTLRACGGNVSVAAEEAQLPRGTFYRLLNRHRLDPGTFRG